MSEWVDFEEFLQCPRCGSDVKLNNYTEEYPGGGTNTTHQVRCPDCGVSSSLG